MRISSEEYNQLKSDSRRLKELEDKEEKRRDMYFYLAEWFDIRYEQVTIFNINKSAFMQLVLSRATIEDITKVFGVYPFNHSLSSHTKEEKKPEATTGQSVGLEDLVALLPDGEIFEKILSSKSDEE